jgi:hypothetical protein
MNPYSDPECRQRILEMQLAVNAASQAATAAEKAHTEDAKELRQEWRDLNLELQQYIQSLKNS